MKILLISPIPPPIGGMASWTVNLMNHISNNPGENQLILCNTAIKGRSITSKSLIRRIYTGIYNSLRLFFKLRNLIKVNTPSIIHVASSASFALIKDCLVILVAKKFKIPVVMHWHFGRIPYLVEKQNWEWKLLCYIINKSKTSIVIDKKSLNTLLNAGLTNVVNIPNPISQNAEQKIKTLHTQISNRQKGRIIFVGHVIKNKGIFELVEACLNNHSINELLIVGPYEEGIKEELLNVANQRDNGTWLKLVGQLDKSQILTLLSKSFIMALPSYTEGFPFVVIEAMAMGCSVIATDVGAIPEMIDCNSETPCGICISSKNVKSLSNAIDDLIKDPLKSEIMGKQGIYKVLNCYTLDKVIIQYQAVWEKASQGKK